MVDFKEFQHFNPMNAFVEETVNTLFNKYFSFENNDNYILPNPDTMFTEDTWHIKKLLQIKSELNDTKSKLNNYRLNQWSEHTRKRNKAGSVLRATDRAIEPEFITQAWCKFYEIVSSFPLVPQNAIEEKSFTSVHLCEAPGAFVTSLNHWLKTHHPLINWDWIATSLNPYYEGNSIERMITDDRFIIHTLEHWNFGPYNTGNIIDPENRIMIKEVCETKNKVLLVTADGSVDCTNDPGEQEQIVTHLHLCETVTALSILSKGGSFLLKMFTVFEQTSISLLYLLQCCFDSIHMFKPATSKEGNSEVYVVCLGFKDTVYSKNQSFLNQKFDLLSSKAMFRRKEIPQSFVKQVIACAEYFKNHQCKVILDNIETFDKKDRKDFNLEKIKQTVAARFIEIYELKKLESEDLGIVGRSKLSAYNNICSVTRSPLESYNERQMKNNLDPKCRLEILLKELQNTEAVRNEFIFQRDTMPAYKLWITIGKLYHRIQSSKFVTTKMLKILNQSFDNMKAMNFDIHLPTEESITKYLKTRNFSSDSTIILKFEHTSEENSYRLINEIHKTLGRMISGDDLVIIGYSLFSQMNVGLLKLVAHFFHDLRFEPDNKLGYVIILHSYFPENNISRQEQENFDELFKIVKAVQCKQTMVLSVYSMLDLYQTKWIKKVLNVNMWNIMCFAKNIEEMLYERS